MTGRWDRLGTVRVRTTAGASLVLGVWLVVSGVGLMLLLRWGLTDTIRTGAEQRAENVAALLDAGVVLGSSALDDQDASLIQVLGADRTVLAASSTITGRPAIADLGPEQVRTLDHVPVDTTNPYLAVARGTGDGRVVLVARSLESVTESMAVVGGGLLVGLPVLLTLVTLTTWVVTGRALRPVTAIRREVAAISATELSRRVTQPRAQDEIGRLARTMNTMLDRLQGSRDRQHRFVSDASHELRNPLASIRHQLEVALAHPERTSIAALAPDLLAEELRMERLVEDLLLLARADEDTLTVNHRPVDLDDLVLAEAARLRQRGKVQVDATAVGAGRLLGDRTQLTRLVRNLTDNAERHAAAHVRLALVSRSGQVKLTVADDGAGILPADRVRIFDRFTRLDSARARDDGGAGLGLAIVAAVAAAHGGTVHVDSDSEVGEHGATFMVALPATETH